MEEEVENNIGLAGAQVFLDAYKKLVEAQKNKVMRS